MGLPRSLKGSFVGKAQRPPQIATTHYSNGSCRCGLATHRSTVGRKNNRPISSIRSGRYNPGI